VAFAISLFRWAAAWYPNRSAKSHTQTNVRRTQMLKTDFMEERSLRSILGDPRCIAQKKTMELLTTSQLSARLM
jgi:hypothetical protein